MTRHQLTDANHVNGKGVHENVNNSDSCRKFNALRIAMLFKNP